MIIDSAGADSESARAALLKADVVITMCDASPVDLWEIGTLQQVVQNLKRTTKKEIPLLFFFNRVSTNNKVKTVEEAKTFLEESFIIPDFIPSTTIKNRISFQHSFREGKTILELENKDPQALVETNKVCDDFFNYITALLHDQKND